MRILLCTFVAWLKSLGPWICLKKKQLLYRKQCFGLSFALRWIIVEIEKKMAHRWSDKWRANRHEHYVIEQYLIRKGYLDFMMNIVNCSDDIKNQDLTVIGNNCPIWVCWWQGENSMPPIVKKCYERLLRMRGEHKVILITGDNYREYVDIPKQLIKKAEKGLLQYAHLADLLRLKLLAKNGGLWIDSTIYCSHVIDDIYTNCIFMSLRNPPYFNDNVSSYRWTSYFLGSTVNVYVTALAETMQQYLLTEKAVIHYFLIDYLIDLLYKASKDFRLMIDNLPLRNPHLQSLFDLRNEQFNQQVWDEMMNDTDFFKTSYRMTGVDIVDGKESFYSHIVNQ